MAKKTTGRVPHMTAKETKETYGDLDQAHSHCLLLIATCTQLGGALKDTELLRRVEDLNALTDCCQKVAERLPGLQEELQKIRESDLQMRTKYVTHDNIMQALSVGQQYEAWTMRFQKAVSSYFMRAAGMLDAAKTKGV